MQQQLTPVQYQQVLKYIQATNQEDFQLATLVLKQHNFNLTAAINTKFGQPNIRQQQQNNHQRRLNQTNQNQQDQQEIVRKFINHVRRENQNSGFIKNLYSFVKDFAMGILKIASSLLMPQVLLKKFLRSQFYILYKDQIKINFNDDKLTSLLMNTKDTTYKSCFLVISPNQKCQQIVDLLNKDDIIKKINQNYLFIGFTQGDNELKAIQNQRPPEIIICRYNVYKQFVVLKRFTGKQQIQNININQLNTLVQNSRNHHKKDKNVLIKYRNFIRKQMYGPLYMQQEQQQQINFVARHQATHEIRQQNQQYKQIQQEQLKRLQIQKQIRQKKTKQKQQIQMVQELRKVRKMSIPDEPKNGQIIRFIMRCPDGSNKVRNFLSHQKVEIIYNWIQTNQTFEVLYGFPPSPLTEHKLKELKLVFDSDQQKLLIRQL